MVDCWHGWATRSFSMKSQIFHITFSHHNLHLILVSFIWLSWTFIFHSVSHHLVIYSEREAHLLRFIVLTAWMFSVRAFQAGDAGIETWNLRQNHLKRSALLNRFPRLSLKSPPSSPPLLLYKLSFTIEPEHLWVKSYSWKKLTTEKTTADVCSFFPPLQRQACKWWAIEEKTRLSVSGLFFTIHDTHIFFFCKLFISHLFQTNIICQPFTSV